MKGKQKSGSIFTLGALILLSSGLSNPSGGRLETLKHELETAADSAERSNIVRQFVDKLRTSGRPLIEDSTVFIIYEGAAQKVCFAGDLNRWNPHSDSLTRIPKTNLFYLALNVPPAARFEYKLVVDSSWILDPLNRQQAEGGYGFNSEITMPLYTEPPEIEYRHDIPHGTLDTLSIHSTVLRRSHPLFVYLPPDYETSRQTRYPSIYVTDGGEYLTLAKMKNVLDNLIADKRIRPVIAIFLDPRTDIRNAATNMRMRDYALSDSFVTFVTREVRATLLKKYRISPRPTDTAIMGASLGGLIAAYTALTHPNIFGLAASQSPSFWWKNDTLVTMVARSPRKHIRFYIDTGTIHDAQEKTRLMKSILLEKGYTLHYEEHPESHNWVNWRARISHILMYFWGLK